MTVRPEATASERHVTGAEREATLLVVLAFHALVPAALEQVTFSRRGLRAWTRTNAGPASSLVAVGQGKIRSTDQRAEGVQGRITQQTVWIGRSAAWYLESRGRPGIIATGVRVGSTGDDELVKGLISEG